ncbi:MAG: flagellar type III secretion system pore protein FliP [Butyricicoccus sp.]|nr:flagellar type III secretion system pore protein FliP [Butyricicoccus sp.]
MTDSLISINGGSVQTLEVIFLTTIIALFPSMLVMMTSFARYIISLSFLRNAMGTAQSPPNLVLIGIALFLTLLTMNPVLTQIQTEAWEPYRDEQIDQVEFIDRASVPLKGFMLDNTQWNTLEMFCDLAHIETPETRAEAEQLSLRVIVPSFMTQELQRAFYTGFLLYLPFLLIDVVVSSTLMSMGMIMLPPAMISTPFKLLLFVSVNGWPLLFSTLVQGVN